VLDPFIGSGTTGMVAVSLQRKYVGIELNKKYCEEIADKRTTGVQQQIFV
jgi:DNA modification methylase